MAAAERTPPLAPYRLSVLIILLCGATAAVWVYRDGRHTENERAEAEFVRRATVRNALTREVLDRYTEVLWGLGAMFMSQEEVTREEFIKVVEHLHPRVPGALAFEWAPYVLNEQRGAFEAKGRRVYAPQPFAIIDFDSNGRMRRAAERPSYVPITLVEPMAGNEIVLGYDLLTGPTANFLERARVTRQMAVTHQFRLRQETGERYGLVISWAVFRPQGTGTLAQDPTLPAGFLQFVFHVEELLKQASSNQPETMIDMLFVDNSEQNPARRVLYFRPAPGSPPEPVRPDEALFRATAPFTRELTLRMGERDWRVVYRPRAGWIETQHTSGPLWRAITLLCLSGLLGALVSAIGRRTIVIHREVDARTAELAESRRQFANLVHALPGMAYRVTYSPRPATQFVSEGSLALTGWSAEEITNGKVRIREMVHPEDLPRVRRETGTALAERTDIDITYRLQTRSGEVKWVTSRGRGVYGEDGKLAVVEGIIIDITMQKRAEDARLAIERKLLESQKLESLGLLAGGIAHDFNNLLSAILGNANLARMTIDSSSPADAQLRAIENASVRAAELCRQMLAYAGKGRFIVDAQDVSAIVEDLLPLLRVSIARSAVLHLNLARHLPKIKADATQLRQIVMNLVLNAVDALAGRNGEITLQTGITPVDRSTLSRCVTGQNLPLGDYVFVEVRDTGCGMSPEVLSKIFDPFFTTKFAGRGLGLAAVLGIVRGHNGALLVESEVGRGSTFRLFLPAMPGEVVQAEVKAAKAAEPWRQTGDVLVIEDEEPVRRVIVDLLKTFGFAVHAVEDGRAGVAAFRENASRWTLVVIDLLMPGMSGEQTLAALQAINPDVRVLLVSGYAEGEIMKRVKADGRIQFMPKPFQRDAFEDRLKELLSPGKPAA